MKVCADVFTTRSPRAVNLCKVGDEIEKEYGIPIVNRRVSVTPISLLGGRFSSEDYVKLAMTLDRAASALGINFIGGYGALVQKGSTPGEERLIDSIPYALASTERVCSSVNVAVYKSYSKFIEVKLFINAL